jgi:hypothetical protein
MNEGSFELPDAPAADRTTHFVETRPGDHTLTLVIVRAPHPQGKTLRQLAQERVLDEMTRLAGYSVIEDRETTWEGVPALEVTSRWRHEGNAFYQQQAHLALGNQWIYFALSARLEGRADADAWFEQIRETIRLRAVD